MNKFQLFLYNLTAAREDKLIRCSTCGELQAKAYDWDYQICCNCEEYLYDYRGRF